ncbi:MAG: hypothetical protein ABSG21_08895 [Spirochaetia bacterium]|jgi:hypothetical protein
MTAAFKRLAVIATLFGLVAGLAFAEDQQPAEGQQPSQDQQPAQAQQPAPGFAFKMGLGIGVQTFNDNPPGPSVTYQTLALSPDFSYGKFGIGLSIALNYNFSGGSGNSFAIRQADWWPTNGPVTFQSVLAIYLPKIAYIRWGEKGDPLFLKLGSFDDATLGDGFIMGDYNNTLFLPTERHFGLQADVDGKLFNFPYVGVESVFGNLAQLDVIGGRAYVRPFVDTSIPILNNLEVGATAAVDTNPYFETVSAQNGTATAIGVYGVDAMAPLLYTKDKFSLLAFTDFATIQAKTWGSMIGVGGRIINIFTYGAQLRYLSSGFTPTYFGPSYDVMRDQQYQAVQNLSSSGHTFGGLISGGISVLDDKLIFKVSLESPFITTETDPFLSEPHLNGILSLAPGALPGFFFNFTYDKMAIGSFADLVSPQNAAIQGSLNFQSGPAVISFVYIVTYDQRQPPPNQWTVTSGLNSSIALF